MNLLNNIGSAGTSAMITVCITHPIDVTKTYLQVYNDKNINNKKTIIEIFKIIKNNEGKKAFWKGIGAGILRESTYTSLRLGLYEPIKYIFGIKQDSSIFYKFMAGSLAGSIGSMAGNPFDIIKTKIITNTSLNNQNITIRKISSDIYKNLGIRGFYRGLDANIIRACVLNGTKMACYDQIKYKIKLSGTIKNEFAVQFCAAFGAGFFMAITVTPFDMIRTKLMNQPTNKQLYSGFISCTISTIKTNGIKGLYFGFIPIWMRFAPSVTLQLLFYENIKKILSNKF